MIEQRFGGISEEALLILEEKSGVSWETAWSILSERREGCDFNVADELLCAVGRPDLWREQPLSDIYFNIDLSKTVCRNPGCVNEFDQPGEFPLPPACCTWVNDDHSLCGENHYARGLCKRHYNMAARDGVLEGLPHYKGSMKIYCSDACERNAVRGFVRRKSYMNTEKKCRNGHPRTPENTRHRKNGKIECLICARETSRAGYHRRKKAQRERVTA